MEVLFSPPVAPAAATPEASTHFDADQSGGTFITEKTWKTIASGQLFLLLAGPGTVAHLREIGLDTFDDIIDHNYYDSELDAKTRIVKLHKVLDDLMSKDLELINQQTKDRRTANAEKFWGNKLYLNNYTLDELQKTIEQCLKK